MPQLRSGVRRGRKPPPIATTTVTAERKLSEKAAATPVRNTRQRRTEEGILNITDSKVFKKTKNYSLREQKVTERNKRLTLLNKLNQGVLKKAHKCFEFLE